MSNAILWIIDVLVAVWAWPAYRRDSSTRRTWFFLSVILLPVLSWFWLVPQGLISRRRIASDRRYWERRGALLRQREERKAAVAFLREQLKVGTELEKINARAMLALWGEPEDEPVTSPEVDPRTVVPTGLLLNGHPSIPSYARGCRCEACLEYVLRHVKAQGQVAVPVAPNGFAAAVEQVKRQIIDTMSVPSVLGAFSTTAWECGDCDIEEIDQLNANQRVVIRTLQARLCPKHGGREVVVSIPRLDRPYR